MENFSFTLLLLLCLYACNKPVERPEIHLVPYPNYLIEKEGTFVISSKTTVAISTEDALEGIAGFSAFLEEKSAISPTIRISEKCETACIHFVLNENLDIPKEGYEIAINSQSVQIRAVSNEGLFYGANTLMQLTSIQGDKIVLPNLEIKDAPRFDWRGMHLDVSRHFMPVSFIKRYIDIMAMYKLNVFHWHLVDGIGWRIEIKSHPELTDIGAWRVVKKDKKPWQDIEAWREGDERPKYGGFYTQEEIKEVIKYAEDRFITILPEIELPGHSEIVFDCYPDLVCRDNTGKPLKNIGVYCANNPKSYELLEDVITEVIELFPSEYIHIGGDEVNKRNWKNCGGCQELMRENNYTPHEVQSHFVNHFDDFIRSKGRKLIGWHEITEGNLSSSSTIMYWGGIDGLENILTKKHPTVIATGTSYYFDHYQSLSDHEPQAWGGYTPLKQVYDLEPLSADIDKDLRQQVLGIQGQIWTEYMPSPKHVEYMLLPRMLALAESAWLSTEQKDWGRFSNAVTKAFEKYDELGLNYSKSVFRPIIKPQMDTSTRKLKVSMSSEIGSDIFFTLDGNIPNLSNGIKYTTPILLDTTATISAISVKEGSILSEAEQKEAIVHKARGCRVTFKNQPYSSYTSRGGATLVDMEFGGRTWGSGKWIGVLDKDLDVTIDLGKETAISEAILSCINDTGAAIYFPASIEVLVSDDGHKFSTVKKWERDVPMVVPQKEDNRLRKFSLSFDKIACRYIRLVAGCVKLPNKGVFIFADELIIL